MAGTTLRKHNRRPPRDPSAAYKPKNALEKAAMKSHQQSLQFQQKLQAANQISICNTTSDRVGRMPLRSILTSDTFCVPIFQRRYCWTETQWQTLLTDAAATRILSSHPTEERNDQIQANAGSSSSSSSSPSFDKSHSLGRLTCTRTYDNASGPAASSSSSKNPDMRGARNLGIDKRSCILDGQQRFTTTTILLAAIRDVWNEQQFSTTTPPGANNNNSVNIGQLIDGLIFTDPIKLRAWMYHPASKLEEGVELPFARLVPTFCDRWSYYAAILPPLPASASKTLTQSVEPPASSASWNRPLRAKRYFVNKLRQDYGDSRERLTALLRGVLDGLTMLYFPIDIHQGHEDGTEDLMVIYERLAWRDATWCRPKRGKEESKSMGGADMIRNLLLGSFAKEEDALDFYKTYWLPMEKLTVTDDEDDQEEEKKVTADSNAGEEVITSDGQIYNPKTVEQVLEAFLKKQQQIDGITTDPETTDHKNALPPPLVGGKIYRDFQAWFGKRMALEDGEGTEPGAPPPPQNEEEVKLVGEQLLQFAEAFVTSKL